MILEVSPDAPAVVQIAATAALVAHIAGGSMGILSGFAAVAVKKGGRLHRVAGTVFFVSMLTMAGVAAVVAPMLPEARWTNTTAAVFTLYLIGTAWAVVRRRPGQVGRFEVAAASLAVGIAALGVVLMLYGLATGRAGGFSTVFAFAVICGLAAWRDVKMIRAGGVSGSDRTARHLWRMCAAFFVATGSFFFGQPEFVPQLLKDASLNVVLGLAPLALLAFWMVRTKRPQLFRLRRPAAA
jgi:hypothetical protein